MRYRSGASCGDTSCAPLVASTILSENQYEPKFISAAKISAITMPCWPPMAPPASTSSTVRAVSRTIVLSILLPMEGLLLPLHAGPTRRNRKGRPRSQPECSMRPEPTQLQARKKSGGRLVAEDGADEVAVALNKCRAGGGLPAGERDAVQP